MTVALAYEPQISYLLQNFTARLTIIDLSTSLITWRGWVNEEKALMNQLRCYLREEVRSWLQKVESFREAVQNKWRATPIVWSNTCYIAMRCNSPRTLTREVNAVVDVTSAMSAKYGKHAKIAKLSISSKRRMIECAHVRALWKSAMGDWTVQTLPEMTL